ncbi:HET-domain-containing protein [Xylaria cf. heliscus]|nr:HET-domain-containing protein [Xylaria cf. heliscus]
MSTADLIARFLHIVTTNPPSQRSAEDNRDVIVLPERWNWLHELGPLLRLRRPCPGCGWDGNPAHLLRVAETHWDEDESSRGYLFNRISDSAPCVSCDIAIKFRDLCVAHRPALASWDLDRWTNQAKPCLVFRDPSVSGDDYEWNIFTARDVDAGDVEQRSEPLSGLPRGELIPETTEAEVSLGWARSQLSHCMTSHEGCQGQQAGEFLPTRLLYVGSGAGDTVRLVDSTTLSRDARRYVALSHCWGLKPIQCMTVRANIEAQKREIAWSSLPATFRDVVLFSRRLGVQFVWIDSICIIQRDRDDWLREAGRMMHVYQHAYLTIGAAHAADSTKGLFSRLKRNSQLKLGKIRHGDQECSLYAQLSLDDITNPYLVHRTEPLFKRAWTFQERIISPRILYFTGEEMVWECYQTTSCQCGFHCDGAENVKSLKMTFFEYLPQQMTSGPPNNNNGPADVSIIYADSSSPDDSNDLRFKLEKSWRRMVGFYSSLALTNATDKLLAIGALAEYVKAARQGESYLAGLWSRSLHADLLWRSTSPRSGRPDDWIAPTWSWASVRSAVRFEIDMEGPINAVADVVDVSCSYVHNNPFGLAERGRLVLRGRVMQCELRKTVGRREMEYFIDHPDLELNIQIYRDSEDGSTPTSGPAHAQSETRVSVRLLQVAETCQYPVALCIALQRAATDDGVLQRWGYVEPPLPKLHKLHDRDTFNQWFTRWSVEETCVIE